MDMIRILNVSKTYRGQFAREDITALDKVTFGLTEKRITAIVGESGCGKTTLLNVISGLDSDFQGELVFRDVKKPKIGYLFQTPSLIPWRTVWQNIVIGPEILRQNIESYLSQAMTLLDRFNLTEFRSAYPNSLSQGMQQRVSLIRLLLYGADLLLLDEAFSRVDPVFRSELYKDVSSLVDHQLKTVILVTHDIEEAVMLADKVIILSRRPGRVLAEIEIPLNRLERLIAPVGKSDLLLPYFRLVWNALNEARRVSL